MTMRYAHVAPASLHEAVLALPSFEGIPKTFGQQAVNTAEKPSLNAKIKNDWDSNLRWAINKNTPP